MFFTLGVSAATPEGCAALTDRALAVDPSVMPVPGPAEVTWRSPDGRAALLRWGAATEPGPGDARETGPGGASGAAGGSRAGTIWAGAPDSRGGSVPLCARTSVTRVDPVYLAEVPGAAIIADRAAWAAWTSSRLDNHDSLHLCALLNPGFPLGSVTPFTGVSAVAGSTTLRLLNGSVTRAQGAAERAALLTEPRHNGAAAPGQAPRVEGARDVAEGLVAAVASLRDAGSPVELSLTGGKDSRLIAAALVKAGVPVVARTHGFGDHPDVVVAAEIARRLGIEHVVRTPAAPGQRVDVLARIRATVLVADGMLSAFENVGRPDPAASPALTAGGHGGELLRGGYAETAGARRGARLRAAEVLRRLTTRHVGLLRRGAAAGYVASLAPWTGTALTRGALPMLDDFYLVNRAGRWSAAARQAYLLRERLTQPLFDDQVVRAARAVPLADRVSGKLILGVIAELSPALAEVPFAGKPAKGAVPATFDWRRQYGTEIAVFLRDYAMDFGATSGLFDIVSRDAAEKALVLPHTDRATVWALATLACLLSGDYKNARQPSPKLPVT